MADGKHTGLYIPEKILTDDQIGSTQKIVYAMMVAEMGDDGVCRLSARRIGELLGITYQTARYARLVLARLGYIQLIPNTQCNYRILHFRKKREGCNG